MTGCLYVVATPIGHCDDWSPRAIATLRTCPIVACEDTRVTQKLLSRFDIHAQLISYRDANEQRQTATLIEALQSGTHCAIVSDAGTPTISDPGFRIVRECRRLGITVTPIPGPCALITALCASGLPTHAFTFLGFLPNKSVARKNFLLKHQHCEHTLIFYESCHRIIKALEAIKDLYGTVRTLAVAREMTKQFETFNVGTAAEVAETVAKQPIRGEYVIVVAPESYQL